MTDIRSRRLHAYFYGGIRYEASPNHEGHTDFCLRYNPDSNTFFAGKEEHNTRT